MIDLSCKPKPREQHAEPEEIVCGILATVIWLGILIGIMGGL